MKLATAQQVDYGVIWPIYDVASPNIYVTIGSQGEVVF